MIWLYVHGTKKINIFPRNCLTVHGGSENPLTMTQQAGKIHPAPGRKGRGTCSSSAFGLYSDRTQNSDIKPKFSYFSLLGRAFLSHHLLLGVFCCILPCFIHVVCLDRANYLKNVLIASLLRGPSINDDKIPSKKCN